MAGMNEMARMKAMEAIGGAMPPEEPPVEEAMEEGGPPVDDLDGALASVEAHFDGLEGDVAEQARTHINALRELASQGEPEAPAEPGAELPPGMGGGEELPKEMGV